EAGHRLPDRFGPRNSSTWGVRNSCGYFTAFFCGSARNERAAQIAAGACVRARLQGWLKISGDRAASRRHDSRSTTATALAYASSRKQDPWADCWKTKQSLSGAIKALAVRA
ncbi:MAG TPA: hypothetical protein VJ608_07825, partial [Albitalea sp.]|nr:hypothetical protein [Albitalea sp.]